jgi:hypothetical protein
MHSTYNFISNLHFLNEIASNTLTYFSIITRSEWKELPTLFHTQKLSPLKIYSINLDQLQTFATSLFSLKSLVRQQEHSYLLHSLKKHTHSTTLPCFLRTISSRLLLQIQIDTRVYRDYI